MSPIWKNKICPIGSYQRKKREISLLLHINLGIESTIKWCFLFFPFKHVYITQRFQEKKQHTNTNIIITEAETPLASKPLHTYSTISTLKYSFVIKLYSWDKFYGRLSLLIYNEFLEILNGNQFLAISIHIRSKSYIPNTMHCNCQGLSLRSVDKCRPG